MRQPLEITNNICVDLSKNMTDIMTSKILACQNEDSDEAFFVCDLGDIVRKYKLWSELLPQVKPFFDARCNDDAAVLTILAQLDVGFNCTSKVEVKSLLDLGVKASRLIYSSPCKLTSHIKYAASHDVQLIEFECEAELNKIKSFHPNAKLLLKVLPSNISTSGRSLDYGCSMNNIANLLTIAGNLNLNVVGISIQTRDRKLDASNIARMVAEVRSVFDFAESEGFVFQILDVGEAIQKIPDDEQSLLQSCAALQSALDKHFPSKSGISIIAEAGRFLVESAFTLVAKVIDKNFSPHTSKENDGLALTSDPDVVYYLSDGVFRSFSGVLYNGLPIRPALLDCNRFANSPHYVSHLLGPTDDSLDCILRDCFLPELFPGDWVLFNDMGAYALTGSATVGLDEFEIGRPECHYTMHAQDWMHLCCCSTTVATLPEQVDILTGDPPPPEDEWLDN